MLRPSQKLTIRCSGLSRRFHDSPRVSILKQKPPSNAIVGRKTASNEETTESRKESSPKRQDGKKIQHVKRNELGVQLLSRPLHSQVFGNVSFPAPEPAFIRISREHLKMHGLDPSQGSVLPDTSFTLPRLQGDNLDEHFYRIGTSAAEPWLSLSKEFAGTNLPPRPDNWEIQSGWTKYYYQEDGGSYFEHVESLEEEGMLCFDVETMPKYHPFAVMATAASKNAWYAWISPWLLGQSTETRHLIPIGNPSVPRMIVGHNVSYDRGRILEEYSLNGTQNRFIDTMALHIAVKGISSHQRPAWMKHRKNKEIAAQRHEETIVAVEAFVQRLYEAETLLRDRGAASERPEELRKLRVQMEESLPQLRDALPPLPSSASSGDNADPLDDSEPTKRWEDLTSVNSLADVAKLHCNIDMDKEIRNDFMTSIPSAIRDSIHTYLDYCANDVFVTHSVFAKVLPAFLDRCPNPVTFAGVLTMGSSFLTVNESWDAYLRDAERTYKNLELSIKKRLLELAEQAKTLADTEQWKDDPWLSQLDWTPKAPRKIRGAGAEVLTVEDGVRSPLPPLSPSPISAAESIPVWYRRLLTDGPLQSTNINKILPFLLKLSFDGQPLQYNATYGWHYTRESKATRLPSAPSNRVVAVLGALHGVPVLKDGRMTSIKLDLALAIANGDRSEKIASKVLRLAKATARKNITDDPWLSQLDWKITKNTDNLSDSDAKRSEASSSQSTSVSEILLPKWYWDLAKPKKDTPPGTVDITVRTRVAPLLLRLSWLGWPLFHSREHGWTFRVPNTAEFTTRLSPLEFHEPADDKLVESNRGYTFYKLPHKDGEKANVGNPLAKPFMKFAQDGTMTSPGNEAKEALDMNAQCSYWISARDRILNQNVVWQDEKLDVGFKDVGAEKKWGVIIPQVITMGTVTRRAIEKTWLTASNAKKNRVGSELKAMVRAPDGYAIVGADVDSEELWISSCMGDAQFGLHGATAIGWMTLEGTKAAGTDLHSKTAGILGISRDQAKVFNYSRIYGAGMRHAVLLLLQSNAGMLPDQAQKLAGNLYASTKGKSTQRTDMFGRKFWFGGTESYLFNKLEEIALSDRPQTPALGCGVTDALSKEFLPPGFGTDYMTSRINWVVQSSGVDYLHLLIVAMNHLIIKYDIKARYLISVHDELRYLVKEEDKYRAALALQIANLWTRSLFAYKLGMDDLPQGVAFFSAVDVDKVLRKEVDMPCVTPSQPEPIPSGESLNITQVLEQTNGGSLWVDGRPMDDESSSQWTTSPPGYQNPDCLMHRAKEAAFLQAQATTEFAEVRHLAQMESGKKYEGGIGGPKQFAKRRNIPKSANVEGVNWEGIDLDLVNEVLKTHKLPTLR